MSNTHGTTGGREFPIGVVYNGAEKHEPVHSTEAIATVLKRAIALFHVLQQPHLLSLFDAAGNELPDTSTVAACGLAKDSVVFLRPSKVKGG